MSIKSPRNYARAAGLILCLIGWNAVSDPQPPRTRLIEFDTSAALRLSRPPTGTAAVKVSDSATPRPIPMTTTATRQKRDKKNIIADSAKMVSPDMRQVLSAGNVLYEIAPMLKVDSVKLFVRHSQNVTDTLGVVKSPPYQALWRYENVPNQDQTHLQFGYILYCPDSVTITSPPLPHRVMIDRGIKPSKKKYRIRQLTGGEFEINGDTAKWKLANAKEAHIIGNDAGDSVATFKLLWNSARLYFMIEVRDDDVTRDDFVELHLDFHRDRAQFSGINHRSLRFSPLGRSLSFVVDLTDSGFVRNDSINTIIADEMERKIVMTDDGYIIEVSVPITTLSDFEFPPSKIGFDVSVMNGTSFYSWAGTERFARYSPRGWGNALIERGAFGLQTVFFSTFAVTALGIVAFIIYTIRGAYRQRREEQYEDDVYSQLSGTVIGEIEKDHDVRDEDEDDDDYDENEVRRRWR